MPKTATQYTELSRNLTPKVLAKVVNAHGSMENSLQGTRDLVFDEDHARTRKDYASENLDVIRRLAPNILRMHPVPLAVRRKMRPALWQKDLFSELFAHMQ